MTNFGALRLGSEGFEMAAYSTSIRVSPKGKLHFCRDYLKRDGNGLAISMSYCSKRAVDWDVRYMWNTAGPKFTLLVHDGLRACKHCLVEQLWISKIENNKLRFLELHNE